MSHVVDIELGDDQRVTDLHAFKKAIERMGGAQFHEGQQSFRYYGSKTGQCNHAATLPSDRQMGLVTSTKHPGTLDIKCDSMDRHHVDRVLMFYQMECARQAAQDNGDIYSETELDDGTYEVECDTTERMGQ